MSEDDSRIEKTLSDALNEGQGPAPGWQKKVWAEIDGPPRRSWWRKWLSFINGFLGFLWLISWLLRVLVKGLVEDVLVLIKIKRRP